MLAMCREHHSLHVPCWCTSSLASMLKTMHQFKSIFYDPHTILFLLVGKVNIGAYWGFFIFAIGIYTGQRVGEKIIPFPPICLAH